MKNKEKILAFLLCSVLTVGGLTGCGSETEPPEVQEAEAVPQKLSEHVTTTEGINVDLMGDYSDKALDASWDSNEATMIALNGSSIAVDGKGVSIEGSIATITQKGTYVVSGTLTDGQLLVNLTEDENVHLVLDGASITCTTGSPIVIMSAKNTYLTLEEGSENSVYDNSEYVAAAQEDEDHINAAVYSKDDLIINGAGSLMIEAGRNDGITSKDDLQITEGIITVHAADDGIVGKDSVAIRAGTIAVTAGGDAIKSSETDETDKGYVVIDGGSLKLQAGDDGIHSETALVINQGTIEVLESVEGLESLNIVINDGKVKIHSSDDGFNIAGGNDSASIDMAVGGGFAGKGGMGQTIDGALVIHGGTVTVDAAGDGLDSNGGILVTGGATYVYGPTNDGNGALDFAGSMEMTGGILFASGSAGMAQAPSGISSQASIAVRFDSVIAGKNEVVITDPDGNTILSATPTKEFECVVVSTPEIQTDETYTITTEGVSAEAVGGDLEGFAGMGGHGGAPGNGMERGPRGAGVSENGMKRGSMKGSLSENGMKPGGGLRPEDGETPPDMMPENGDNL